ncbi:hypothetical protein LCGC14_2734160 [marine sediment metagenome]|uniref:Uncharacterized protein n=1 Tax=marine sediment metagenome TaxID=412755 RepID=A0A0F9BFA5_9ZZZZ
MNGLDFINKNISKKQLIALATLIMLAQSEAPPIYLMAVGIVAILAQGVLDFRKDKDEMVENSG